MALPNPVVVIPGITAAYLQDEYPLPPETIWAVITKNYDRAALHPDNILYEALEPARVRPGQLYEIVYKELIEELRFNLREREDAPVPVFPFSYDWRQPLEASEAQLPDFVKEVIDRTKLLKHYHAEGYGDHPKVNMVGHSMGGLIIAGYLARVGREASVDKVATLATPYQGSFEAIIKISTGTANLGAHPPSSREREAARVTPALYYLIPSFLNGLVVEPGLPTSLFEPGVWQPSVIETIAEYVRLRGLDPEHRAEQARALFSQFLASARGHRSRIDGFRLQNAGLEAKDWLCVVGVNADTRVRLKVVRRDGMPDFDFGSEDRRNEWEKGQDQQQWRLTGDGTVPFEGAVPKFLGIDNLVCVLPEDFGAWELRDKAFLQFAGFHGILPDMDMLHRLIARHFTDGTDLRGNTWGRPAPGVTDDHWNPPIPHLRRKT